MSPVLRVAMVGPFGLEPKATMRVRALPLARALADRGHQVQIFMPPWQTPAEADRGWEDGGVFLRYVPLDGGVPGVVRSLVREVIAIDPDVVHTFKPKAYSGLTAWWLWYTQRRERRLITDTDDWEGRGGWNDIADYTPWQKRHFDWQERWGLTHHHGLTVASRALAELAGHQGVAAEDIVYLPNAPGIDTAVDPVIVAQRRAALGLTDRPVVLLYSRLFEFDIERLVAVLKLVHAAIPDLAILTVGAGLFAEDQAAWNAQLKGAGLAEAVVDVGWLAIDEVPATIAAADVGLYLMDDTLLNRTKCPVKLADMTGIGLPVVAEEIGQVSEYVQHERTGKLAPSGDVDALAAGLIHLLSDADHRRRIGAQARLHMSRNMTWAKMAERVEALYLRQGLAPHGREDIY